MKRLSLILLVVILGALGLSAQSLADVARRTRAEDKQNPPTHVYTNDDVVAYHEEQSNTAKATGTETAADSEGETKAAANGNADAKADKDKKDSPEVAAKKAADFKKKISDKQKAIADQEREINLMEREHQIRVAEYYADAGTQLRTGEKWFQDEKKYQEGLEAKKKALSDAKAALDDLMEQARKAGVPSS